MIMYALLTLYEFGTAVSIDAITGGTTIGAEWLVTAIVLLPLLTATIPFAVGSRYERFGWPFAVLVLSVTSAMAVALSWNVFQNGPITYLVGGIDRPFGVEFIADELSVVVVVLILLVSIAVLVYMRVGGPHGNAIYAGFLLINGGMLGVMMTGDIFNLYVFLEIMALSSYALVSASKYRWSTYAAFKYLLVGTIGASFYLLGVGFAFAATGTLNMADLSVQLAEAGYESPVVIGSFVFMTVGLAIKIALFPVHTWLADAHASAPDGVSAVISALVPAVALYALARLLFSVFTPEFLAVNPVIGQLLLACALASLFAGSIFAILQDHIKLVLAYSTVSQFGLMLIGITIANETAIFGSIVQLFGHGIVKASLFLLAGMFALRFGGIRRIEEYGGLAKRAPVMAGAFAVLGVAMVGLPPSVGFVGKWYIALGAFQEGLWVVSVLVLGSTLLSAAYMLPFINRLYFHSLEIETDDQRILTRGMILTVVVGAFLGLGLGLVAVGLRPAVESAIAALLAGEFG